MISVACAGALRMSAAAATIERKRIAMKSSLTFCLAPIASMVYRGNATWQGGNRMMEFYAALHEVSFRHAADFSNSINQCPLSGVRRKLICRRILAKYWWRSAQENRHVKIPKNSHTECCMAPFGYHSRPAELADSQLTPVRCRNSSHKAGSFSPALTGPLIWLAPTITPIREWHAHSNVSSISFSLGASSTDSKRLPSASLVMCRARASNDG